MKKFFNLFKLVAAFLLLSAFTLQTFNKAFIMFNYIANTQAFAKNCENKAKPQIKCKGKCQMLKKMRQEEKKDEQNPERKTENQHEFVLSTKSFYPVVQFFAPGKTIFFLSITSGKATKITRFLLRPPIC